jgi:hypothetical protein
MRPLALLLLLGLAQDPKAARSVHLGWTAPEATEFHLAMTVQETTPGSYFMACGWNTGYFGIQELSKGDKIVLFSLWDPTKGDDAKAVPVERRVEVLNRHADAKIGRFGGEGTGAQCKYPYAWKTGETCRFLLRAAVDGEKTTIAAWFRPQEAKEWTPLATFRGITKGSPLKGLYSFVEDFRRDGKSVGERRRARYSDGWVRGTTGDWVPIVKGRFTADATPLDTIDAAVVDGGFTLATGGDLKPSTPLKTTLVLPDAPRTPPADLPP